MKAFTKFGLLIVGVLTVLPFAVAQGAKPSIEGDWNGLLDVGGAKLRLVFHVHSKDGALTGTLDSLDQGAKGIPLDSVTFADGRLRAELKSIGGSFNGTPNADLTAIEGNWTQGARSFPLKLTREAFAKPVAPNRPQVPKKPYPYKEEMVQFDGGAADVKLAGTLTEPAEGGPFPAVILVSGSGPNQRNEEVFQHPVFMVLADYLTRQGFAVLRYDKRGCGESTGSYAKATTFDFTDDAQAAVAFMKGRKDVRPDAIGALGHSEGGIIVPMLANRSADVKCIVMMAGPGIDGGKILELQSALIARADGEPEKNVVENSKWLRRVVDAIRNSKSDDELGAEMDKIVADAKAKLTPDEIKGGAEKAIDGQRKAFTSPWMKTFVKYDPAPALTKLACPVLAVNGSLDLQVPSTADLPVIEASLKSGGNKDYTVKELPSLNHLFQDCKTGSPSEYGKIEETISPAALKLIGDWLKAHLN